MRADRPRRSVPANGVAHLKILVDAGILTREQRGKWAYYRLVPGALDALAALIASPAV